jgi:hypothetical protein
MSLQPFSQTIGTGSSAAPPLDLTQSAATFWDWQQGFHNPHKKVRFEFVPSAQQDAENDELVWVMIMMGLASTMFLMDVQLQETVADFRERVAAYLGKTTKEGKTWHMYTDRGCAEASLLKDDTAVFRNILASKKARTLTTNGRQDVSIPKQPWHITIKPQAIIVALQRELKIG